ncbi:MAG: AAA family ATPase [Gemmatimonadota bacterium]|nr:AAA family ATPase [Gemmatimonadota bacterium]
MRARARVTSEEIATAKRAIAVIEQSAADAPSNSQARPVSAARPLRLWLEDTELMEPPKILIPYLAVAGRVSLLSGREKIGKSTLAAVAVAAASRGDPVLGIPLVGPVTTLWYALDEHVSDPIRRFQKLQADTNRIAINDEPRTVDDLLDALEIDLETHPDVDHVTLDNLSRILAFSGIDPNSKREVEPAMARLVDFFHTEEKSATLIYHTGKAGREYSGNTAIGANVDEILTLRKRGQSDDDDFAEDDSDDGRRLLVMDGRNLRGRLQLSFRDGVYSLFNDATLPEDRILETIRDHGTVVGRAELVRLSGVRKSVGLKVVGTLIGSGRITENGRQLKSGSAGSPQFPQGGTKPEPTREPLLELGSHSGRVGATETGTDTRPTRIENGIEQVLRPTQHGLKWFDVGAA